MDEIKSIKQKQNKIVDITMWILAIGATVGSGIATSQINDIEIWKGIIQTILIILAVILTITAYGGNEEEEKKSE